MSQYKKYFDENKVEVNKRAIATKIIDMIQKLELNNTEESGRRWIWELIQNAKDVSDEQVIIKVDIKSDRVIFKHNGKPFKVIHLTSLINQVSAKDRNSQVTTGKFGTGFLTTHLLSKNVQVEGVLKELNEPYKKFSIELDRRSEDIHTLADSVEKTMRALDDVDESDELEYISGDMSTSFTYYLETEQSKKIAEAGYEDLNHCIDYVLMCQPKVKEVLINNISITSRKIKDISGVIAAEIYEINKGDIIKAYIKVNEDNTSIMVPITLKDEIIYLEDIDESIPRLFCDFPCIGTENFQFPVIINDSNFYLTEPRDGVYLTNNQNNEIIRNKYIIKTAIRLWENLFKYLANQNNILVGVEKLLYFPSVKYYEWQDDKYIEENVIDVMKSKADAIPFISVINENSLYAIKDVCFPNFETEKQVAYSIPILEALQRKPIANNEYLEKYRKMNCHHNNFIDYETIVNYIETRGDLNNIITLLFKKIKPIEVINNVLKLLQLDEMYSAKIKGLKIFPMLNGNLTDAFSKISLSNVEEHIRECYIQYFKNKNTKLEEYFDLELDLTGIEFTELTTREVVNLINEEKVSNGTICNARALVCATPPKGHHLYNKQQKLFEIVSYDNELQAYDVDDYTHEYISRFGEAYIKSYIKNKRYVGHDINVINSIIDYILDYNLVSIGREMTVLFNEEGVAKNYINMKYNRVTKEELYNLYRIFVPGIEENIISSKYKRLDELLSLPSITNNLVINEINKKVFELLSIQNPTTKQSFKLQAVYDYLQENMECIDEEFPSLKEKMYFMCSKDIMIENQNIIQEMRTFAKDKDLSLEECISLFKEFKNTECTEKNIEDDIDLGDYTWGIEVDFQENILDRIRYIGDLGERYGFAIIIQNYEQMGYEVIDEKEWIVTLQKEESIIELKLFYGTNQEGYDVVIKENGEIIKYIEIKSTTKQYLRFVKISKMQLAKASKCYWEEKADYQVMCIMGIESSNIGVVYIDNPFKQLYENKLKMDVELSLV